MSQALLLRAYGDERSSQETLPTSPPPPLSTKTATTAISNDHVDELTTHATRLRHMTQNVQGILQLTTGEARDVLGDEEGDSAPRHEDGRDVARAPEAVTVTSATMQIETGARECERLDTLLEQLREAGARAQKLQIEKGQVNVELEQTSAELARVQELLSAKTAQVNVHTYAPSFLVSHDK